MYPGQQQPQYGAPGYPPPAPPQYGQPPAQQYAPPQQQPQYAPPPPATPAAPVAPTLIDPGFGAAFPSMAELSGRLVAITPHSVVDELNMDKTANVPTGRGVLYVLDGSWPFYYGSSPQKQRPATHLVNGPAQFSAFSSQNSNIVRAMQDGLSRGGTVLGVIEMSTIGSKGNKPWNLTALEKGDPRRDIAAQIFGAIASGQLEWAKPVELAPDPAQMQQAYGQAPQQPPAPAYGAQPQPQPQYSQSPAQAPYAPPQQGYAPPPQQPQYGQAPQPQGYPQGYAQPVDNGQIQYGQQPPAPPQWAAPAPQQQPAWTPAPEAAAPGQYVRPAQIPEGVWSQMPPHAQAQAIEQLNQQAASQQAQQRPNPY
jgi:hypothetical protein